MARSSGGPDNPLTHDQLVAKFAGNAGSGADEVVALVEKLDGLDDLTPLFDADRCAGPDPKETPHDALGHQARATSRGSPTRASPSASGLNEGDAGWTSGNTSAAMDESIGKMTVSGTMEEQATDRLREGAHHPRLPPVWASTTSPASPRTSPSPGCPTTPRPRPCGRGLRRPTSRPCARSSSNDWSGGPHTSRSSCTRSRAAARCWSPRPAPGTATALAGAGGLRRPRLPADDPARRRRPARSCTRATSPPSTPGASTGPPRSSTRPGLSLADAVSVYDYSTPATREEHDAATVEGASRAVRRRRGAARSPAASWSAGCTARASSSPST